QFTGTLPTELSGLTSVQYFVLNDNEFTGAVPSSLSNITTFVSVNISKNNFTSVPTFPNVQYLTVHDNPIDFADLEQNTASKSYSYAPLDSVGDVRRILIEQQHTLEVIQPVGGSNNVYQWYKDGFALQGFTSDTLKIENITDTYSGKYHLKVTNPNYSVNIFSKPIYVTVTQPSPRVLDSLALVDFYNSTGGSNWTRDDNWLSSTPINQWYGVQVENDRVTRLILYRNNLRGQIPTSIKQLSEIKELTAYSNALSGNLPTEIGSLIKLERILLGENSFTGSLPASIGNLKQLNYLSLYKNGFSGSIPDEISDMNSLGILALQSNSFSGSIPSGLGQLTNLTQILLYSNQFSGSIPSELGNLSKLTHLQLYNNKLSGAIPSE
ncbi:hypothetical protein ACHAWF_001392, partial [Thalassiosira exigua]